MSCISILMVRKFQRKYFNFNFSRYSNSYFTESTGFIFSLRVGITEILFSRELFDGRIIDLCSLHQCLDSPNFPIIATFFSFHSIFKLVLLSYYDFEFLHHELSLKSNTCREVLDEKPLFCSLHQSHDSPKFP